MGQTIRMEPPSPTVLAGDERPWAGRRRVPWSKSANCIPVG
jgi:hypothetical protein